MIVLDVAAVVASVEVVVGFVGDEVDVEGADVEAGAGRERAEPTPKNATGANAGTGNEILPDELIMKNVVSLDFSNTRGSTLNRFERIRLDPSIKLNRNDPNLKHFNTAVSYFLKSKDEGEREGYNMTKKTIDHIEYVVNRELQEKFEL